MTRGQVPQGPGQATEEQVASPGSAVDEAIGSLPDPLSPDQVVPPRTAVDEAIGSLPDPPAVGEPAAGQPQPPHPPKLALTST